MGDFEQFVMMAVLRLGDDAYGAAIRREIRHRGQRPVSLGAVYTTLSRLEEKGMVSSWLGSSDPERGGRPKRFYTVEAEGREALRRALAATDRMRSGLDLGLSGLARGSAV